MRDSRLTTPFSYRWAIPEREQSVALVGCCGEPSALKNTLVRSSSSAAQPIARLARLSALSLPGNHVRAEVQAARALKIASLMKHFVMEVIDASAEGEALIELQAQVLQASARVHGKDSARLTGGADTMSLDADDVGMRKCKDRDDPPGKLSGKQPAKASSLLFQLSNTWLIRMQAHNMSNTSWSGRTNAH